ncbi:MAG: branched-chain amino acid ABC transporter permease [Ruminococcus sp.]
MSFEGIIQTIIGGLGSGTVYALLGISFTLIFGRLKICSVMHGDIALLAAYMSYWLFTSIGFDPIAALIIIVPILFLVGYLVQNLMLNKFMNLETWKGKYQGQIMVTFGLAMVIMAIEYFIFTGTFKTINVSYRNLTIPLENIYIPVVSLAAIIITVALVIGLELILKKTSLGIKIRACSIDRVSSQLAGINYRRVCAITFGISTAVAGIAGVFFSLRNQLGPSEGLELTFLGWVAVIIGGMGDLKGSLIAGLSMGVAESLVSYLWLPAYAQAALYLILLLFLIFRPNGLFTKYVTDARSI